jgi:hypothetical protein
MDRIRKNRANSKVWKFLNRSPSRAVLDRTHAIVVWDNTSSYFAVPLDENDDLLEVFAADLDDGIPVNLCELPSRATASRLFFEMSSVKVYRPLTPEYMKKMACFVQSEIRRFWPELVADVFQCVVLFGPRAVGYFEEGDLLRDYSNPSTCRIVFPKLFATHAQALDLRNHLVTLLASQTAQVRRMEPEQSEPPPLLLRQVPFRPLTMPAAREPRLRVLHSALDDPVRIRKRTTLFSEMASSCHASQIPLLPFGYRLERGTDLASRRIAACEWSSVLVRDVYTSAPVRLPFSCPEPSSPSYWSFRLALILNDDGTENAERKQQLESDRLTLFWDCSVRESDAVTEGFQRPVDAPPFDDTAVESFDEFGLAQLKHEIHVPRRRESEMSDVVSEPRDGPVAQALRPYLGALHLYYRNLFIREIKKKRNCGVTRSYQIDVAGPFRNYCMIAGKSHSRSTVYFVVTAKDGLLQKCCTCAGQSEARCALDKRDVERLFS